jgi:hypothetical protein
LLLDRWALPSLAAVLLHLPLRRPAVVPASWLLTVYAASCCCCCWLLLLAAAAAAGCCCCWLLLLLLLLLLWRAAGHLWQDSNLQMLALKTRRESLQSRLVQQEATVHWWCAPVHSTAAVLPD